MSNIISFIFKAKFNIKKAIIYKRAYKKILNLDLFNEEFYKNHYSSYYSGDGLEHYLFYGYKKGFAPSLDFNSFRYLEEYPDVKKSGLNPLVHYALYGINEGKSKFPSQYIIKDRLLTLNKLYLNNQNLKNEPFVSIVLLNRNGLDHLKRLFKNFSRNTNYSNFELIFIDNGSNDGSVEYVKSLNTDFNIKIIENNSNLSFSKANNIGVQAAEGEYILLLNNDVEPSFGWLNEMILTYLNNKDVGAVGAKLVFPFYNNMESDYKSFKIQHSGDIFAFKKYPLIYGYNQNTLVNPFDDEVNKTKEVVSVTAAAMLIKKSIYEELGGLDEGYIYGYEDVDFCLKLNKAGYRIFYCSSALIFHHESSTRTTNEFFKENSKRLIDRWYNYLNRNIYLDKINNDKFFCEKPLKFLLIHENPKHIKKLFYGLKERKYVVEVSDSIKNVICDDLTDIIISFSPEVIARNIESRKNTIKILWMTNTHSNNLNMNNYDLIIISDYKTYEEFEEENNVYFIENNNLDVFIDILRNYIVDKYN